MHRYYGLCSSGHKVYGDGLTDRMQTEDYLCHECNKRRIVKHKFSPPLNKGAKISWFVSATNLPVSSTKVNRFIKNVDTLTKMKKSHILRQA